MTLAFWFALLSWLLLTLPLAYGLRQIYYLARPGLRNVRAAILLVTVALLTAACYQFCLTALAWGLNTGAHWLISVVSELGAISYCVGYWLMLFAVLGLLPTLAIIMAALGQWALRAARQSCPWSSRS